MRLPLVPTEAYTNAISAPQPSSTRPPLAFINEEPFLIELQGSLELPGGGTAGEGRGMAGVSVGKMDTSDPNKPILQIAHHRLEGRIVTLAEPYALLRSTPAPVASAFEVNDEDERPSKRSRNTQHDAEGASPNGDGLSSSKDLFLAPAFSSPEKPLPVARDAPPLIEIVGLVRKKIVFSKRPEPISHPLTSDPAEAMSV